MRRVKPASKWPSIEETVLMSTPFCRATVANVCLKSWSLICSSPALFRIFWCRQSIASGYHIPPFSGDGNMTGLSGCFSCSCMSRSMTCCETDICRMGVSVFGCVTFTPPPLIPTACLLMEIFFFSMFKSSHANKEVLYWFPPAEGFFVVSIVYLKKYSDLIY